MADIPYLSQYVQGGYIDKITGIKAIFFDFGGTLYDVDASIVSLWLTLLRDAGFPAPDKKHFYQSLQAARAILDEQTAVSFYSKRNPEMAGSYWVSYNALILENMGIPGERSIDLSSIITNKLNSVEKRYEIIQGVKDTLIRLSKRYKLGLISNTSYDIRRYLDNDGIKDLFAFIGLSYELGLWKPDARIFSACSKFIGTKPSECLFVGDSLLCDVKGATTAGMIPILIDYSGKNSRSLISIQNLDDLFNLLG